nr:proline-rich receptor-like protein kinase PERK10 [Procambarus clarkii]
MLIGSEPGNPQNTHRGDHRKPRPHPQKARGPRTNTHKTGLLSIDPGPSGQLKPLNHKLESLNRILRGHEQDLIVHIQHSNGPPVREEPQITRLREEPHNPNALRHRQNAPPKTSLDHVQKNIPQHIPKCNAPQCSHQPEQGQRPPDVHPSITPLPGRDHPGQPPTERSHQQEAQRPTQKAPQKTTQRRPQPHHPSHPTPQPTSGEATHPEPTTALKKRPLIVGTVTLSKGAPEEPAAGGLKAGAA